MFGLSVSLLVCSPLLGLFAHVFKIQGLIMQLTGTSGEEVAHQGY